MKTLKAITKRVKSSSSSSKESHRRFSVSKDITVVRGGYNIDLSHVDDSFTGVHRSCLLNESADKLEKILTSSSIDPNQIDQVAGSVALHIAIVNGNLNNVRVLLTHGSDVNQVDREGKTPLIKAVESGHDHLVKFLLYNEADANLGDREGNTPLMWAVMTNNVKAIETLFESSQESITKTPVDVNRRNTKRETSLHLIAKNAMLSRVLPLLLERQAVLNVQDSKGRTPLIIAASVGNKSAVEMLLDRRADHSVRDSSGKTASETARSAGFTEIASIIESHEKIHPISRESSRSGSSFRYSRRPFAGITTEPSSSQGQAILLNWSDSDDDLASCDSNVGLVPPVILRPSSSKTREVKQSEDSKSQSSFNPVIQELQSLASASGSALQPSSVRRSLIHDENTEREAQILQKKRDNSLFLSRADADSEDYDLEPAIIVGVDSKEKNHSADPINPSITSPTKTTNEDFLQNLRDLLDEEIKSNNDIDQLLMNDVFPPSQAKSASCSKDKPSIDYPAFFSNDFADADKHEENTDNRGKQKTIYFRESSFSSSEESVNCKLENSFANNTSEEVINQDRSEEDSSLESKSKIPSFVLFLEDFDDQETKQKEKTVMAPKKDLNVKSAVTPVKEEPVYSESKKKSVTFDESSFDVNEKRVRFSESSSQSSVIEEFPEKEEDPLLKQKSKHFDGKGNQDAKADENLTEKPKDSQTSKKGSLPPVKSLLSSRPAPLFLPPLSDPKVDSTKILSEINRKSDNTVKHEQQEKKIIWIESEEESLEEEFSEEKSVDEIQSEVDEVSLENEKEVRPLNNSSNTVGEAKRKTFETPQAKEDPSIFPFNPRSSSPVFVPTSSLDRKESGLTRSPSRLSSKESFDEVIRFKELYEREKASRSELEEELQLLMKKNASYSEDYHELLKAKIELEEKSFQLESTVSKISFDIEQLKAANTKLKKEKEQFDKQDQELRDIRNERKRLQENISQLNQEVKMLTEKVSSSSDNIIKSHDEQLKNILESNSQLSQQNKSLKKELLLKETEIMRMRKEFDAEKKEVERNEELLQKERDSLKIQLQHLIQSEGLDKTFKSSLPLARSFEETNLKLIKSIKDLNHAIDHLNQRTGLVLQHKDHQNNNTIPPSSSPNDNLGFLSKDFSLVYPGLLSRLPDDRRPQSMFVQNLLHISDDTTIKPQQKNFYDSKNNLEKEISVLKNKLGIFTENMSKT